MTPYFFSKITLKESAPIAKLRELLQDSYAPHRITCQLTSEEFEKFKRENPTIKEEDLPRFLYRFDVETRKNLPQFYLVSPYEPKDSSGVWDIQTKEYPIKKTDGQPIFTPGERFGFSLRANPTKNVDTEVLREYKEQGGKPKNPRKDKDYKTRRVDVIWEARCKALQQDPRPADERSWTNDGVVLEAAQKWLAERASRLGFEIEPDSLLVERYDRALNPKLQHQQVRTREEFGKAKKLATLDLTGVLKVTNTEDFEKTLLKGIGHGKTFGCGLLLIRRV